MAFDELKEEVSQLQVETKEYIESTLEYYKLRTFKLAMKSVTKVINFILLTICALMLLLFISIAGSLAIGELLDSNVFGFLIVAGFYLFLFILFRFIKPHILEGYILRRFSEIFFND